MNPLRRLLRALVGSGSRERRRAERRSEADRRAAAGAIAEGDERRSRAERRSGTDRREGFPR
jgi:hypothetical protein